MKHIKEGGRVSVNLSGSGAIAVWDWIIPGPGDRRDMKRCGACCHSTVMPFGYGSPKNDDECRPVAAQMLTELRRGGGA